MSRILTSFPVPVEAGPALAAGLSDALVGLGLAPLPEPALRPPAKPPYGAVCNRCGECCVAELCPLAVLVFGGHAGPCPALERDSAGLAVCGLAAHPKRHLPAEHPARRRRAAKLMAAAAVLIGAGSGCDSKRKGEPDNRPYRKRMEDEAWRDRGLVERAWRAWGFDPLGVWEEYSRARARPRAPAIVEPIPHVVPGPNVASSTMTVLVDAADAAAARAALGITTKGVV